MPITGPLFKCFGSKWLSSRLLPKPEYDAIVEPFAGGAGYSLRHYEKSVKLYEKDEQVAFLWRWLIHKATSDKILEIPLNLPVGTDIREIGLSPGQELLLKHWQRTNNVGNCWTVSSWGHLPGMWTANSRARVAEEHCAIRHWQCAGDDWHAAFDGRLATFLVDPPYQYNYQYRQPPIDYEELAQSCLSATGQIVVCEAVCPKSGRLPMWLPFVPWAERVTSRRVSGRKSSELICELDNAPDTARV